MNSIPNLFYFGCGTILANKHLKSCAPHYIHSQLERVKTTFDGYPTTNECIAKIAPITALALETLAACTLYYLVANSPLFKGLIFGAHIVCFSSITKDLLPPTNLYTPISQSIKQYFKISEEYFKKPENNSPNNISAHTLHYNLTKPLLEFIDEIDQELTSNNNHRTLKRCVILAATTPSALLFYMTFNPNLIILYSFTKAMAISTCAMIRLAETATQVAI